MHTSRNMESKRLTGICLLFLFEIKHKIGPNFGMVILPEEPIWASMSLRRIFALKNAIPKRGLEEFLDQTKEVGKDMVYGIFGCSIMINRTSLEVFGTSAEEF